jgi:serine/threonine protein kinase
VVYGLAHASWVHRDLSICNIYSVDGQLKLGDLEYAKKFGQEGESGSHDLRTVSRIHFDRSVESHRRIGDSVVLVS